MKPTVALPAIPSGLPRTVMPMDLACRVKVKGPLEPAEPARASFVCSHCGAAMRIIETFLRGQSIRAPPVAKVVYASSSG